MTHTRKWRTTIPSRFAPGNSGDDAIKALRVDIGERMAEILAGVGDWTADPVVSVNTKYEYIHWSRFINFGDTTGGHLRRGGIYEWHLVSGGLAWTVPSTDDNRVLHAPVLLPRGVTVTEVVLTCATGAASTIGWVWGYMDVSGSPSATSIATGTVAAATAQGNAVLTTTSHAIDSTPANEKMYYLKLTLNSAATDRIVVQGARFKYTVPSLLVRA